MIELLFFWRAQSVAAITRSLNQMIAKLNAHYDAMTARTAELETQLATCREEARSAAAVANKLGMLFEVSEPTEKEDHSAE